MKKSQNVYAQLLSAAKMQALKKSASKGDRKKKKEVTEEMARLEAEVNQRHENEILELKESVGIYFSCDITMLSKSC